MNTLKRLSILTIAAAGFFVASGPRASAQVAVQIGPAPECPYGYYEEPPYNCAPDGYYGPEWFAGGMFVGVGPWYHGRENFYGHVDHHYDYRQGYQGRFPARGERPAGHRQEFYGQAMHDVHGHEAPRGEHERH